MTSDVNWRKKGKKNHSRREEKWKNYKSELKFNLFLSGVMIVLIVILSDFPNNLFLKIQL